MFRVVIPYNKSCADVQVAPRNSPRQSSKPVFLEKLGGNGGHLEVDNILVHSTPVSSTPAIFKGPAT